MFTFSIIQCHDYAHRFHLKCNLSTTNNNNKKHADNEN